MAHKSRYSKSTETIERSTGSEGYKNVVSQAVQELEGIYPKEILDAVKLMMLSKDPAIMESIIAPAFGALIPTDEKVKGIGVGINCYSGKVETVMHENKPRKVINPVQPDKLEHFFPTNNDKIDCILGIDTAGPGTVYAYFNSQFRPLIDTLKTGSDDDKLEDKVERLRIIQHLMKGKEKFQVLYDVFMNNEITDLTVIDFAENYLLPLCLDPELKDHTFVTHSFGGAFLEAAQRHLVKKLNKEAIPDREIQQMFNKFRVLQFGFPITPSKDYTPRMRTYSIMGEQDVLPPQIIMERAERDKYGEFIGEQGFQVITDPINPQLRSIFLSEDLFLPHGKNFGGHLMKVFAKVCFGEDAPENLKGFLAALVNYDSKIRNETHYTNLDIFNSDEIPLSSRDVKDNTIRQDTIKNMVAICARQFVVEIHNLIGAQFEIKDRYELNPDKEIKRHGLVRNIHDNIGHFKI